MSKPNAVLAEPLTLETSPRGTRCSGKALLLSSLLIGLVFAVSLLTRREVSEPAIDMFGAQLANPSTRGSLSCPAVQQKMKQYGIPSGPMAQYALTQYVATATRDVSMAAQAQEEFANLDPVTQAKLKQLRKDVVVKASTLNPEDMAGITAPLGFFDPWGLSKKGNIEIYRKAELKHGRVCMLAFLGMLVTEKGFHPFYDAWGDGPFTSAVASHFSSTAADNFWPAFWINTAAHEFAFETTGTDNKPADGYVFDPLGLAPKDPAAFKEVQNKELNNGRLAMLAAAGIMAQELVTGKKIF